MAHCWRRIKIMATRTTRRNKSALLNNRNHSNPHSNNRLNRNRSSTNYAGKLRRKSRLGRIGGLRILGTRFGAHVIRRLRAAYRRAARAAFSRNKTMKSLKQEEVTVTAH